MPGGACRGKDKQMGGKDPGREKEEKGGAAVEREAGGAADENAVGADAAAMESGEGAGLSSEAEVEEIQEFVVSSAKTRSERKKAEQASVSAIAAWSNEKKGAAAISLFAAVALAFVLLGIFVCDATPVMVCAVLVINVALAALLGNEPLWLHACVALADIVLGLCTGRALLMALAAIIYAGTVFTEEMLRRFGLLGRA